MNKFSNSAGKLYALSAGESKLSTVTVLHLLPACYSLCCVNAPKSSHHVKTPFCAIALYRSQLYLALYASRRNRNSDDTSANFNYFQAQYYSADKFRPFSSFCNKRLKYSFEEDAAESHQLHFQKSSKAQPPMEACVDLA